MESKPPEGIFPATQWSVVLAAGGGESPPAARALDSLCRAYWVPLYAFVRRSGYASVDALRIDLGDASAERIHRLRLGILASRFLVLEQMWPLEEPLREAWISARVA